MPFGKYRDEPIDEIPTTYLHWVLANIADLEADLHNAIKREVQDRAYGHHREPRRDARREAYREPASNPRPQQNPERVQSRIVDAVQRCRRKLAAVLHPDRGGSTELMQTTNGVFDDLADEVRRAFADV
jgi:hypothetical protein